VAKFPVIVGQFILKDWTVVKIMGTAVVVGSVGVYALLASGHANLHVKPFLLGGVLLGGVCFGVGMAVFGYCPGTGVAACGEGKPDAMVGVLGMLAGALAFVAAYPAIQPVIKGLGDMGKITFPEATGTSPWLWIVGLLAHWRGSHWPSPPPAWLSWPRRGLTPSLTPDLRGRLTSPGRSSVCCRWRPLISRTSRWGRPRHMLDWRGWWANYSPGGTQSR